MPGAYPPQQPGAGYPGYAGPPASGGAYPPAGGYPGVPPGGATYNTNAPSQQGYYSQPAAVQVGGFGSFVYCRIDVTRFDVILNRI